MSHHVRRNAKQPNYLGTSSWVIIQPSRPPLVGPCDQGIGYSRGRIFNHFQEVRTTTMGRQVLLYLTHFFKRLQDAFTPSVRDDAEDGASPLAVMIIVALCLYIAGGLGVYAKHHYWDHLTDAQKTVMIQSMAAAEQTL